jgi:tetraacyldisaccharide 4'-kinase
MAVTNWSASALWSTLTAFGRFCARRGWIQRAKLPCRVISVGNIQVGGAGKTPLVALIAREAHERGYQVCILCRGYGGEWEKRGGLIAPGSPRPDSRQCGDEAALLHELAPNAYIAVGAHRALQFAKAQKRVSRPFDLAVLDDGFQHLRIQKDVEIVALTSARRTRALFRDWKGALRHAHLEVWTKGEEPPPHHAGKPRARIRYDVQVSGQSGGLFPIGKPLWLVTGLADPGQALESIRQAGFPVQKHVTFRDHARYARESVLGILEKAAEQGCAVAVTGKDWVKWRDLGIPETKVRVLEPELVFVEGRDLWLKTLWEE